MRKVLIFLFVAATTVVYGQNKSPSAYVELLKIRKSSILSTRLICLRAGFFPLFLKKVVEFQKTLAVERPIRLGTPAPYVPPKKMRKM